MQRLIPHYKKLRPLFTIFFIVVLFSLATQTALAQTINLSNPLSTDNFSTLISFIIVLIFKFVGIATLLMFVWGGFLWLTAAGVERRIKQGMDTMMWAVIGLAVIFGAYVVLNFIIKGITT